MADKLQTHGIRKYWVEEYHIMRKFFQYLNLHIY
jgi:hypothetical protein